MFPRVAKQAGAVRLAVYRAVVNLGRVTNVDVKCGLHKRLTRRQLPSADFRLRDLSYTVRLPIQHDDEAHK
jgi:hypothetical protein